jgi:hypothetical protein
VVELREAFAHFLGKERFAKFVECSARNFKLKFKQQRAWEDFISVHPEFKDRFDDLKLAIRICQLHGDELLLDSSPALCCRATLLGRLSGSNSRQALEHYPNAESGPHLRANSNNGAAYEIWYCPTCREREAEWKAYLSKD